MGPAVTAIGPTRKAQGPLDCGATGGSSSDPTISCFRILVLVSRCTNTHLHRDPGTAEVPHLRYAIFCAPQGAGSLGLFSRTRSRAP